MENKATLSKSEELFMKYKNGMAGSGMIALIEAIFKLYRFNRAKIALGFSELVTICKHNNEESGYREDLQER